MEFNAHILPEMFHNYLYIFHNVLELWVLYLKLFTTLLNPIQTSFSSFVIRFLEPSSVIRLLTHKDSFLKFCVAQEDKFTTDVLKAITVFIECFDKLLHYPNLMWNDGKMISYCTKHFLITFFCPGFIVILAGHFLLS